MDNLRPQGMLIGQSVEGAELTLQLIGSEQTNQWIETSHGPIRHSDPDRNKTNHVPCFWTLMAACRTFRTFENIYVFVVGSSFLSVVCELKPDWT